MTSFLLGPKQGVVYSSLDEFGESTIKLLGDANEASAIGENGYLWVLGNHDETRNSSKFRQDLASNGGQIMVLQADS